MTRSSAPLIITTSAIAAGLLILAVSFSHCQYRPTATDDGGGYLRQPLPPLPPPSPPPPGYSSSIGSGPSRGPYGPYQSNNNAYNINKIAATSPGHSSSSSSSGCYDRHMRPVRCTPEFVNAAYNSYVEATNTCGLRGPSQYCVQTGAAGSTKKTCDICDASNPANRHPPEYLVDFNDHQEHTWWQSETLFEGKWPQQINLTLSLGKDFEITYVRVRFHSPRAESFAIFKKTHENSEWEPFQYYSSNCYKTYSVPDRYYSSQHADVTPLCTKEFSDISPLTGGNVVFTTLEGRPNATNFEHNEALQVGGFWVVF